MTVSTSRSSRRTARLAAAVLVTAAAGLGPLTGLVAAPASAAVCDSATGVSVIADFNELGGGVVTDCIDDGAGRTAADLFTAAGLPLTDAQRQPGFVCRVAGKPTSDRDPCVNTSPSTAYWGLWWSDGDAGSTWAYSSQGARSLTLPAGSLVAFSWDETSGDARPSAAASRPGATATASPTASPTPAPSAPPASSGGSNSTGGSGSSTTGGSGGSVGAGGSGGSGGGGKGGTSAQPDDSTPSSGSSDRDETDTSDLSDGQDDAATAEKKKAGKKSGLTRKDKRGTDEETDATPAPIESSATAEADPELVAGTDAAPAEQDALAGWVGPTLIVVLFGGAAAAWWLRRRATPAP